MISESMIPYVLSLKHRSKLESCVRVLCALVETSSTNSEKNAVVRVIDRPSRIV